MRGELIAWRDSPRRRDRSLAPCPQTNHAANTTVQMDWPSVGAARRARRSWAPASPHANQCRFVRIECRTGYGVPWGQLKPQRPGHDPNYDISSDPPGAGAQRDAPVFLSLRPSIDMDYVNGKGGTSISGTGEAQLTGATVSPILGDLIQTRTALLDLNRAVLSVSMPSTRIQNPMERPGP
jgi:hypothetical protein